MTADTGPDPGAGRQPAPPQHPPADPTPHSPADPPPGPAPGAPYLVARHRAVVGVLAALVVVFGLIAAADGPSGTDVPDDVDFDLEVDVPPGAPEFLPPPTPPLLVPPPDLMPPLEPPEPPPPPPPPTLDDLPS